MILNKISEQNSKMKKNCQLFKWVLLLETVVTNMAWVFCYLHKQNSILANYDKKIFSAISLGLLSEQDFSPKLVRLFLKEGISSPLLKHPELN